MLKRNCLVVLLYGTLLNYLSELGVCTMPFEGGQHQNPASIQYHSSAIWLSLYKAGCLSEETFSGAETHYRVLHNASLNYSELFEVVYHHQIKDEEDFHMLPGFKNFQKLAKNQLLAYEGQKEIRCNNNGYLFMPLYQSHGKDGFFIIRKSKPD